MRIGRRSADVAGTPVGALWVTPAGYPRLVAAAAPDDDQRDQQDEGCGGRRDPLVPELTPLVRDKAHGLLAGVVRRPAGDLFRVGADDELVDGARQPLPAVVDDLLESLRIVREVLTACPLVSAHAANLGHRGRA